LRECRLKIRCDSLNLCSAKSMSYVPDNVNRSIVFWVRVNRQASLASTIYIYNPYGYIKRRIRLPQPLSDESCTWAHTSRLPTRPFGLRDFYRPPLFMKAPTKGQDRWYFLWLQKRISLYAVLPSAFVSLFRTHYNKILRRIRESLVICVSLMVNFGQ
jgi:hypothetical protein